MKEGRRILSGVAGPSLPPREEFEAVYGGSTTCADGAWHIANCSRCDARLRPARALAEAQARAEHWAAQADRLAGQVEAMRAVMLEVAESAEDSEINDFRPPVWAERLRQAAGGGRGGGVMDEARKKLLIAKVNRVEAALEGERHGIAKERERIRRLALAGTEWLEPSDFVPPRASSREGDLWRRAQAVARRELADEIAEG